MSTRSLINPTTAKFNYAMNIKSSIVWSDIMVLGWMKKVRYWKKKYNDWLNKVTQSFIV
jgi:hypothetical protein